MCVAIVSGYIHGPPALMHGEGWSHLWVTAPKDSPAAAFQRDAQEENTDAAAAITVVPFTRTSKLMHKHQQIKHLSDLARQ